MVQVIAALEKPRQGMMAFVSFSCTSENLGHRGQPFQGQREPGLAGLILQSLPEILFEVSEQGNVADNQLQLFRVKAPS